MSVLSIVLTCIVIYVVIAAIVYLVTREIDDACFWIFYLAGNIVDAIVDSDSDFDFFD